MRDGSGDKFGVKERIEGVAGHGQPELPFGFLQLQVHAVIQELSQSQVECLHE